MDCLQTGNTGQKCENAILMDNYIVFSKEQLSVASASLLTLSQLETWVEAGQASIFGFDVVEPANNEVQTEETTHSNNVVGFTEGKNLIGRSNPSDRVLNYGLTGGNVQADLYAYIVSKNNVFQGLEGSDGSFKMKPIRVLKLGERRPADGAALKAMWEYSDRDVYASMTFRKTVRITEFSLADLADLEVTDISIADSNSSVANNIQVIVYDYDQNAVLSDEVTTANIVVTDSGGSTVSGSWTLSGDVLTFDGSVSSGDYVVSGDFLSDRFNLVSSLTVTLA